MKLVADHLLEESLRRVPNLEFDLFARSAFNRYYYSIFLTTRSMLGELDNQWTAVAHKNIPTILKGSVCKRMRAQAERGLLPRTQAQQLQSKGIKSARHLASMLESAYQLRVTADYEPETPVLRSGSSAILFGTKSSEAANWPTQAETLTRAILDASRKLGLT